MAASFVKHHGWEFFLKTHLCSGPSVGTSFFSVERLSSVSHGWIFNTLSTKFCFSPRKHGYSVADTPLVNLMVCFVYTIAVVLIRLPV